MKQMQMLTIYFDINTLA